MGNTPGVRPLNRLSPDKVLQEHPQSSEKTPSDIVAQNPRLRDASVHLKDTLLGKLLPPTKEYKEPAHTMFTGIESPLISKPLSESRCGESGSSPTNKVTGYVPTSPASECDTHGERGPSGPKSHGTITIVNPPTADNTKQGEPGSSNTQHAPTSLRTPSTIKSSMNLPRVIKHLLTTSSPLDDPALCFEPTRQAASKNFAILASHGFDLEAVLHNSKHSITAYGSEFKSAAVLKALFARHPRWPQMQAQLQQVVSFLTDEVPKQTYYKDLIQAVQRGNHRSADKHAVTLEKAILNEIRHGWMIPLKAADALKIPNIELAPLGVAEHLGVNEYGEFIPKRRVTHDLSFLGAFSNQSVNSRVRESELEPCMFGFTLLRVIHQIVNLRKFYPTKRIWIRKDDLKSAYRHIHMNARTAVKTAVRCRINGIDMILISLRLVFGGSPCPSEFSVISDMATDAINDLLPCRTWDHTTVVAAFAKNIPPAQSLDSAIPFAAAKDMVVAIPLEPHGKADCFIDDIITVAVDLGENRAQIEAAPCTILHAMAHKASNQVSTPRDEIIALNKNSAEGEANEEKLTLGWILDTRRLRVKLPSHKQVAWSSQIRENLTRTTMSLKTVESILGRLENIATVMRLFGNFLNNI